MILLTGASLRLRVTVLAPQSAFVNLWDRTQVNLQPYLPGGFLVEFLFQRQFPALTPCTLTVESRDNEAIKILGISTATHTADLVFNANQLLTPTRK
jgi:hypothetical protein